MPPSPSPTPSPPPSPLRDILNLTQQLTPSKSPRTQRKIRQQLQVSANDAQQESHGLKRRAVDAEQTRKPQKKRRRGDRARGADSSEVNPEDTEARVREAGRFFALRNAIFLIDDDVLNTKHDPDFDLHREYESSRTERQGQLHDILEVLPEDVRPKISHTWVQDSFLDGLSGQRSFMRNRIRTQSIHYLVDDVKACATSASRFENFSAAIGYKPATDKSQAYYHRWAVPVIHENWNGRMDLEGLFRGPLPVKIYVSCIRGAHGAEGVFEGLSKLPQARCLQRIHKIDRITVGAIVISCILAIWLLSPDTILVQVGDETNIDYGRRGRLYVRRIREALEEKKAWALGLLDHWDRLLFPNADKKHDYSTACDELDDDEEVDNIFSEAPPIPGPQGVNSQQAGNDDDDQQSRSDNDERSHRSDPTTPSPPRHASQTGRPHHASPSPQSAPSRVSAAKRRPAAQSSQGRGGPSGPSNERRAR
ncbi:hypothetical protein C8R47DRAFT_1143607 [Mycena vitilis]|nr:hypothetical protein C8R47DRAFT_1143607 [Mycena vitilis]